MSPGPPEITKEARARALGAVLGKAEGELVASYTAPLCWVIREPDGSYRACNGSAFFLDAGAGVFGVTAAHVISGWQESRTQQNVVACHVGDLPLNLDGRHAIIDAHDEIDIATFRISAEEVRTTGKTILTGYQSAWSPPTPPQRDCGVSYAGFPGVERRLSLPHEISFGIATGGGVVSSISETDICSLIEREHLIATLGEGLPPENYDFGGISGGPMLMAVEYRGLLRTWALAGVVYQGPNTSPDPNEAITGFEIIRARPAHFILPDGTLDTRRWEGLTFMKTRQ
jgi:hypothetical protein